MAPPFIGVAVNVTLLPAQIEVELAVIVTVGVTEFTVTEMELLEAVGFVVQLALLVITTETTSLLLSNVLVKDAASAPGTLAPFIFH
jgi:2-keto-4-pentenoate hydratase